MNKTILYILLFLGFTCMAQPSEFAYRRKLTVAKEGWSAVTLPTDVFQHINTVYSDLRILQLNEKDTTEVPYLLRINNDEVSEGYLSLPVLNKSTKDGKLYLTFKLSKGQEVNYLDLEFEEANYNGYVKLEGSNDQKEWFELVNRQRILSIQNSDVDFTFSTLNFPLTNYTYLRAAISNDKPLTFTSASFRTRKIKAGSFYNIHPKLKVTQDKKNKQTTALIDLAAYQPLSKVSIKIDQAGDYYRYFALEVLRDSAQAPNQTWTYYYEPITNGYLTSIEANDFEFIPVNAKKLKLTISNADNAPLNISDVSAAGPQVTLVAQLMPGNNYVFYGNASLSAPTYDLVHFTNEIPNELNTVGMETEEKLIADKAKASPLLENKMWLWAAMGLVIALLGFATLKMMSKK